MNAMPNKKKAFPAQIILLRDQELKLKLFHLLYH